jgi:hypothetical protein
MQFQLERSCFLGGKIPAVKADCPECCCRVQQGARLGRRGEKLNRELLAIRTQLSVLTNASAIPPKMR